VKNPWVASIVIPIVVIVIVAAVIVGVGELYLALGETPAIIAAIVLMVLIAGLAAIFSMRTTGSASGTNTGTSRRH
jgi:hypothetical protein